MNSKKEVVAAELFTKRAALVNRRTVYQDSSLACASMFFKNLCSTCLIR